MAVFERLQEAGLYRPGVLIFPLHGIGILGFGAFRALGHAETTIEFVHSRAGILFSPQTNSDSATVSLVRRAAKSLGIKQAIPRDSLEHHLRLPVLSWL